MILPSPNLLLTLFQPHLILHDVLSPPMVLALHLGEWPQERQLRKEEAESFNQKMVQVGGVLSRTSCSLSSLN